VPASPSPALANAKPAVAKPAQPDLITRYNLASKIANEANSDNSEITSTTGGKSGWSQNKNERQALLQKRREEMILVARRKMQAKVAAEAGQGDAGIGQP